MLFKSLAVYIGQARIQGISREECLGHADDYGVFLAKYDTELIREQAKHWGKIECLPLSQISLAPRDYCLIVKQIYSGKRPQDVEPPGDSSRNQDSIEAILERVNMLLAAREEGQKRVSGLVVGRVQSGKTSNYIELLLKAVSEGWNVVIVLTSNNAALGRQTYLRVKGCIASSRDAGKKAKCLNYMNVDGNISFDASIPFDGIANGDFYWGIVLKETNHLDNVLNWIAGNRDNVQKMSILVIDDEADNASVDANPQGRLLSEDAIQDFIEEIPNENQLLKEWLSSLLNLELSDSQRNTLDKCMSRGTAGEIMDRLLRNPEVISMLSLNDYINEDGESFEPITAIREYFNDKQNHGKERTKTAFIRLLRSIFNIVQASSTINRKIRQLISMRDSADDYEYDFKRCAYIGYTATPYACIFNRPANETPLYPDFIYSLGKAQGYFGLDEIFGSDMSHAEPRMPIVTVITSEDNSLLQKIEDVERCEDFSVLDAKEDTLYLSYNTLHYASSGESSGEKSCEQLKNAIAWAYCCSAVRRFHRRTSNQQDGSREACFTTMLINLSALQNYHRQLQSIISSYIDYQCSDEHRDAFRAECRAAWMTQTTKLTSERFTQLFGYEAKEYPSWEEIQDDLTWFLMLSHCKVIQINSTVEGREGQQLYEDGGETAEAQSSRQDTLWFICGGNTISRGLTLAGLCVSFFDRVNRLTAVDTYIQMGRWFGYRRGYELLPRIWMPEYSIQEYKKAAVVEEHIHNTLKASFDDNISPSEGENFLTVYYWGRKLSGRAFAVKRLTNRLETAFVTNEISTDINMVQNVALRINRFLCKLDNEGHRLDNHNAFEEYVKFPIWSQIPSMEMRDFIDSIIELYPESSKRILRGLILEINREADDLKWDVVLGTKFDNQQNHSIKADYNIWGSFWAGAGKPIPTIDESRATASYSNAHSVVALYAMIDKKHINAVDADILELFQKSIIAHIEEKQSRGTDNTLPNEIDMVLPQGETLEQRLSAYIAQLRNNLNEPIAPSIRSLLQENINATSYANRSCREYRKRVYEAAGINHPVMQIYPVTPSPELDLPNGSVLFSLSFYWPNHTPNTFTQVALGLPVVCAVSEIEFYHAVQDVLKEYDFIMPRESLRDRIVNHQLKGRCNDYYFNSTIASGVNARYKQFKRELYNGNVSGYYALDWAKSDEEAQVKFKNAVQDEVCRVLLDNPQKEFSRDELLSAVSMNPRLDTFLHLAGHATDKQYFAEKVMTENFRIIYNIGMNRRSYVPYYRISPPKQS